MQVINEETLNNFFHIIYPNGNGNIEVLRNWFFANLHFIRHFYTEELQQHEILIRQRWFNNSLIELGLNQNDGELLNDAIEELLIIHGQINQNVLENAPPPPPPLLIRHDRIPLQFGLQPPPPPDNMEIE